MDDITREPTKIRAEDINPRYNWGRALPALGIMGVDFEERVDYRRLHRYRLGRVKAALAVPPKITANPAGSGTACAETSRDKPAVP